MTVIAGVLLLIGAVLMLTAAVGVVRFPDVLARLHAATKAASIGIGLILVGAGAALGPGPLAFTVLVATFHLLTAPVAAHALARAVRTPLETETIRHSSFPFAARVVGLSAVWVVLWRDFSPANVLVGVVIGAAVATLTRRRSHERIAVRPWALLKFVATLTLLFGRSTVAVAAAALGPRRLVNPSIERVPLSPGSTAALLATANAVSLTPGTMTLALDTEAPALVVHLLRADYRAVTAIATLHSLAAAALPRRGPDRGGSYDPRR